jgi:xylulokinase
LAAAAGVAFATVSGVSICGVTRTQVFLDARGKVLRPALTWRDRRSAAWAERLVELAPNGWAEAGQLNAFHPAARVAWLMQNEPANGAALHAVVDPKDYLNFCLTGIIASDIVSSARILAAGRPWPDGGDLFQAGLLPRTLLSIPFLQPTEQVGPVQAGLPGELARLAGVPVFSMANDTWATAAGMGALADGVAYNISGTTEVLGVIGKQPVTAPGLLSVDWGPSLQQIGGPSQSGADTLSWFFDMLTKDGAARRVDTMLSQPRQATPALFLPFLSGERTPYWEPMLRAAWFGLNREHRATDLAYAILEGVAFLNRTVLERAEAAMGDRVQAILFGGGGSANAIWAQIKADVTGRPVRVGEAEQPGLLGGAIVAWTGLGVFPSISEAQQSLVRTARAYEPDPQRSSGYHELFDIWTAAVAAARPISERLAVFRWS